MRNLQAGGAFHLGPFGAQERAGSGTGRVLTLKLAEMTCTPYVVPASRAASKVLASDEVPGSSPSTEAWCQTLESADASLRRGVAESRDRCAPTDPEGWLRPGTAGRPRHRGRGCSRPQSGGTARPPFKLAELLAASQSSLPPVCLPSARWPL